MNKYLIAVIVVLIIAATAGYFLLSQNNSKQSGITPSVGEQEGMMKIDEPVESGEAMMKKDEESMSEDMKHGSYVEYSKEELEKSADKRRVLFFYASWCPTCRPTDTNLKANLDKLPEDLKVIRVNYNDPETDQEEKDLARKYGITYQHTFVQIDSEGKEITKWNGGQLPELLANIK